MFDSKKFKLKFLQRVNPYRFISMINDNEPIQEKFQNVLSQRWLDKNYFNER